MSDTEKSVLKGFGVVLATMFVLAGLVGIGAISGRERTSQPIMQAAGMMGPKMRAAEILPPALSQQDFRDLVHCVHEIESVKEVVVPGSERPGGKYLTFDVTLLYTIDLRLEDSEGVIGAMVYSRDGRKKGWFPTAKGRRVADKLTAQDFVNATYDMLNGPCTASALARLGS